MKEIDNSNDFCKLQTYISDCEDVVININNINSEIYNLLTNFINNFTAIKSFRAKTSKLIFEFYYNVVDDSYTIYEKQPIYIYSYCVSRNMLLCFLKSPISLILREDSTEKEIAAHIGRKVLYSLYERNKDGMSFLTKERVSFERITESLTDKEKEIFETYFIR